MDLALFPTVRMLAIESSKKHNACATHIIY